ncbi:MAG: cysteine--tRNA ligase [Holosporales bacterium]|jgi:cysteinyl-tRNA synthetase|nr:cysteine--tRNA ligase [Holosporales bacterium]
MDSFESSVGVPLRGNNGLKLYNTLTGQLEKFIPIDENEIKMYVCGPTVYGLMHVGNARAAVVFDVLYRVLRSLYERVTYVRNITDVDDKIYAAATERHVSITELTSETIAAYHEDLEKLNVLPADHEPRVTENMREIIDFVVALIDNKSAYITGGHVYFDVSSFAQYGALSKKNTDDLFVGARVDVSELKRSALDFVLWKPADEKFSLGWESPWGKGRPGWHIECSAMALKYLGDSFDIHGGGMDLIFPHHENEIAQSLSKNGKKAMANYWVHNGHLTINGAKMSKSLGNFVTVRDLCAKYDGEVIRLALLMTHYAAPMNFEPASLEQAKNILDRWYTAIRNVPSIQPTENIDEDVFKALADDMNTPKAISILSAKVDDINKTDNKSKLVSSLANTCRKCLGLMTRDPEEWFCGVPLEMKAWIKSKIAERVQAKKACDFKRADAIRAELFQRGIAIEDTQHGTIWKTT